MVSSSVDDVGLMHGFYRDWMGRQEGIFDELQSSVASPNSDDDEGDADARLSELVERATAHYIEYYHAKSRVAQDNVFLVFSPTWLTPLERSFLWITGFKPGLVFQITYTNPV
uniref:DOG1 domain-containing protein n=1 Tax=Kalanchoe fedtschenkoi TaxID=63787 RepID=A0A7N0SWE1_KALFE